MGIDRTNVGQIVDELEAKGLVRRSVNGADRRARELRVTTRAANLRRRMRPRVLAAQASVLSPLKSTERVLLIDLLTRVVQANEIHARPGAGRRHPGERKQRPCQEQSEITSPSEEGDSSTTRDRQGDDYGSLSSSIPTSCRSSGSFPSHIAHGRCANLSGAAGTDDRALWTRRWDRYCCAPHRAMADGATWQTFVIENWPGAGGNLGTEAVVRSPPDGYTLALIGAPSAINATLYEDSLLISSATLRLLPHCPLSELVMQVNHRFRPRPFPNSSPTPRPTRARSTWRRLATGPRPMCPANCSR